MPSCPTVVVPSIIFFALLLMKPSQLLPPCCAVTETVRYGRQLSITKHAYDTTMQALALVLPVAMQA
eukprot:6134014-Amphidinium_carterae.1